MRSLKGWVVGIICKAMNLIVQVEATAMKCHCEYEYQIGIK